MKILQVIGSLQSGGAERLVVDLSNELVKQGHEVIIVTLKKITADSFHYAKFLDANIKVLPMNLSHEMRYGWWALLKVIFKYKPDIIHAHLG